jgi:TetR/AcrR family fatty acid metabolism transcriptional regulator
MNKTSKEKKLRFKPEERRTQIIETTKELILENGLPWASSLRIAKALEISQQALYHPFKNKHEILLATLSSVMNDIIQTTITKPPENQHVDEFLREATRRFYKMTIADPRQSRLLFEYLCAPPTEDLRDEIKDIFTSILEIGEHLVQEGIAQGIFREDLDITVMSWIFCSLAIAANIGMILETPKFLSEEQALNAINIVLGAIKK